MSTRAPERWRAHHRLLLVAGLLLLLTASAWAVAEHATPRQYVTGLWPIGLGTGAVLVAPARTRLLTSLGVGAIAVWAVVLRDAPTDLALCYGVGTSFEVYVAARLLRGRAGQRPELRTDSDLYRYFGAAFVGASLGAAVVGVASFATHVEHPYHAILGVWLAHFASQLYVVPVFSRLPLQGAIAGAKERAAQWGVLLVALPTLLVPDAGTSLIFLFFPILAWGALRITPRESLVQLLLVLLTTVTVTLFGAGPFAAAPERYGLPGDYRGVLLSAFAASCSIIIVPLILRVGEYMGAARDSAAERDLVRGIVDGATGVAIVGTDPEGRITLFNPGAERLLGYRAEEVLGRNSRMLHSDQAVVDKAIELGVRHEFPVVAATMVERRLVGTPVRFLRKDGTERTHAMTLTRLAVAGETSGFVATSEDITDQLDAEQALRDALETQRRALERLRDVDTVKDQFVSTVSHELRTPITSIMGYLEMLVDGTLGDLDTTQLGALRRVHSNSQRLLALIDDLLTLSRFAEDGLRDKEPFDLRSAVRAAYDVVAPSWEPPRWLDVTLALPETPVMAYGSAETIERLVVNLLSNAVKFTDNGGAVTISLLVDPSEQQSMLRVADTGIGIPEDEQAQLFNRFFRSSLAESRAIQGSGLGLSISRAIVEHHGGVIEVHSRQGEGTTVDVRLPMLGSAALDEPDEPDLELDPQLETLDDVGAPTT